MGKTDKLASVIISILAVSGFGIILRYNNLDTYFILAGFRFHLSFVLPFFIAFRKSNLSLLKKNLLKPAYNKTFQPLLWIFLPLMIILAVLYFLKKIEVGDPEYFYEFGLSSIFDLPLYIIWNMPQLLMLFSFLIFVQPDEKAKLLTTSLIVFFLFAFEFIPLGKDKINFFDLAILLFSSLNAGIILKYFKNAYWFGIFFFMIFWLNLLAFGSNSTAMIHILFASQYTGWEGFFEIKKGFGSYLLPVQIFLSLILLIFTAGFSKSKN
jgi:hypothetical protein